MATRRLAPDHAAALRASLDGVDEPKDRLRSLPVLPLIAASAWLGCAMTAVAADELPVEPLESASRLLLVAATVVAWGSIRRSRRGRLSRPPSLVGVLVAVVLLACGHTARALAHDRSLLASITSIAARDGIEEPRPVEVIGTVATTPRISPLGDRLHAFFRQPRATFIELDLESIGPPREARLGGRDKPIAMSGRMRVRIEGSQAAWPVGERLRATGLLLPPLARGNPGEPPPRLASLEPLDLGTLLVRDRRLGRALVVDGNHGPIFGLAGFREEVRQRVGATLARMIDSSGPERAARLDLLEALLIGDRRGEAIRSLRGAFVAAGLAHFLAISGFHLAVLAAVAAALARILGVRPSRRALVAIAAMAVYAAALPTAPPVLRATLAAALLAMGMVFSRRWDPRAATALAALVILSAAPGEAVRPAFQLSFAAVFSLQTLAPRLRGRWFGEPDRLGRSRRSILRSRAADAVAASVAAWAITTPIALCHFGHAALFGVPATILATPLIAATIALATVAVPVAILFPVTAAWTGPFLGLAAAAMIEFAEAVASLDFATVSIPAPGPIATVVLLAAVSLWLMLPRGFTLAAARGLAIGAIAALLAPSTAAGTTATFLAVGDGTAIVIARHGRGVLVDCGSIGDRSLGASTLPRALDALGVRRLDAVVVSHPNLDHFSGLLEVAESHPEASLVVGEAFIDAADLRPHGPERAVIESLAQQDRKPSVVAAGDRLDLLGLNWSCLHPPPTRRYEHANDASLVWRIEAGDSMHTSPRDRRPLLVTTGDLQAEGLRSCAAAIVAANPRVAEVPHHGSATIETAELLARLPGTRWVQSTGPRRLRSDRLATLLAIQGVGELRIDRTITARDGAVSVSLDPSSPPVLRTWKGKP